jgi:hypothetical protein
LWGIFGKHHYLSAEFNKAAKLYLIYWNDTLVAMNSVLPIPSGTVKHSYRTHRLVVLPDYQGLGIGTKINEFIAKYYIDNGNRYYLRTTHVRLIRHMRQNPRWLESKSSGKVCAENGGSMNFKYDTKRVCGSFEYMGQSYAEKPHMEIVIDKIPDLPISIITDELKRLKETHYLTVIHGIAAKDDVIDEICKSLGIRTNILYINKKGTFTKKNDYINSLDYFENFTPEKFLR